MLSPRELAIACRCQLLIGSYTGSNLDCPCESFRECKLTAEQRESYATHPKVLEAYTKNKADYDAQNTPIS